MPLTLHAATVPSFLQIIASMSRLIDTAQAYCSEQGIAPEELIQARLAPDMLPFAYQMKSVCTHSLGAIEGVRKGTFSPDRSPPPESFADIKTQLEETMRALEAIAVDEMEVFIGQDMEFRFGDFVMEFAAEDFLLSFSQPNFYFHATTAYDILRMKGLPIGKRDFNGRVRQRPAKTD